MANAIARRCRAPRSSSITLFFGRPGRPPVLRRLYAGSVEDVGGLSFCTRRGSRVRQHREPARLYSEILT
jgi:hypothetical protein